MGLKLGFGRVCLLLFILVWVTNAYPQVQPRIFNVIKYGAVADGKIDNTEAFMKAWSDACQWKGRARVLIPLGTYMVGTMKFKGPCKGSMAFIIKGTLKARTNPSTMPTDQWITFQYIDRLAVSGGGSLDGQGALAWPLNDCYKNPNCLPLPISMRFDFVTNSRVRHLRSINSKNSHFMIYGCENMNLSNVRISAPANSPNTDGIDIGSSKQIKIFNNIIGTGDDCISLGPGNRNIDIFEVQCGPGHGISVGSLGKYPNEEDVMGITVKNCTFSDTSDGLRIKTWASPLASKASNFTFEDIVMHNVRIPINIDQMYCPYPPCNQQTQSHVQISDVTYRNISGTASSEFPVSLRCSESLPCRNIVLKDINLSYHGPKGPAAAMCAHVNGKSYGQQNPPSCLPSCL